MAVTEAGDVLRPGGLIRQRRYNQDNFAIFDASNDAITANWTTEFSPTQFVNLLLPISDADDAVITVDVSKPDLLEMDINYLSRFVEDNDHFDEICQFVRIDLSETRTVAWQAFTENRTIADEARTFRIVGFGDSTSQVLHNDDGLVRYLLFETATEGVDVKDVLKSMNKLASQFDPYQ